MTDLSPLVPLAQELIDRCKEKGLTVATAESCTGGLIAGLLTEIPGSSAVMERGFVTYSNEAKMEMLGVARSLLEKHGAVSREVAIAMAEGVLRHSPADLALSVTGIAGPDGGSAQKPVGLVHFGFMRRGRPAESVEKRFGDLGRKGIRLASVKQAVEFIYNLTD